MKFLSLIKEGRKEDFLAKYARKFSKDQLDRIVSIVTPKYLDWVGKTLDAISFDKEFPKLTTALNKFEKISSNLPITDLYQYNSISQLISAIETHENKPKREIKSFEGGNVVYDDARFFVVNPLTHKASCYYGAGTKWCTTSNMDHHFNSFNEDGKLFYILDRNLSTSDPNYKIAILKKFDGAESAWDAIDIPIRNLEEVLGGESYQKLTSAIRDYMSQQFPEQLKLFSDKELARLERIKLQRARIQREREERLEEAQERRENSEWTLDQNCPEEGLKAHALLDWLDDNNDITIRTYEDNQRIQEIKNEIVNLNQQYDQSEDVETDLLDQISDLEDELEELESTIDVYFIVPIGEHYDMTRFKVLDPNLDDRVYAVGTEEETEDSAKEYVEQLINDIGYDGFNRSFYENYIDDDQVLDYARDWYEDDVYQNPEVYLDEDDRQLSSAQVEEIEITKNKIQKVESAIENIEEVQDETGEDYSEKIDELREQIEEMESEIEDIESSPDGDFPDDLMEEKVQELVDDVRDNIRYFMSEHGLSISDYIDHDKFVEGVIEADGLGVMNGYDGNIDEQKVLGQTFYVMRID